MGTLETNLENLEMLLVQEFRVFQHLHDLSRRERLALVQQDTVLLQELIETKQQVLDRLRAIYASRQEVLTALHAGQEREQPAGVSSILDQLFASQDFNPIAAQAASRLDALLNGISTLNEHIFELSQANQAAADAELRDMESLRDYLREQSRFQRSLGQPVHIFGP